MDMEKRIYFESKKIRKLFFEKLLEFNELDSWKDFIIKFKVPRKTLDSYKNGKLTLPNPLYEKMILNFNKDSILFFEKNIIIKDSNWGRVKGGISTFSKHKEIFQKGRKIAHENRRKYIPKFDINLTLTKELSYFIGLFIGDGFTNKYGKYYLIQFTGDKRKELIYYSGIISKISNELFNLNPKIKEEKKTNALRVNFYSLSLFKLITERFKIKAGRKSRDVLIPEEILNSSDEILLACIAGIYDAEGCFYFDKRKYYKLPYPAIALHMNNPRLIKQISDIFIKNKIEHSCTNNYSTLYIYGKNNVKLFLSKIILLNPKYELNISLFNKIK
jgi:hypothetical protein